MKITSVLLFLAAIGFAACEKTPDCGVRRDLQLSSEDVFMFGSKFKGGFTGGGNGNFKITGGKLYLVLSNRDSLLSNEKYEIAKQLTTSFPEEMSSGSSASWKGDCTDMPLFHAEIRASTSSAVRRWEMEKTACSGNLIPYYAECYRDDMEKIILRLW
jgi:hypothetical protein